MSDSPLAKPVHGITWEIRERSNGRARTTTRLRRIENEFKTSQITVIGLQLSRRNAQRREAKWTIGRIQPAAITGEGPDNR